jgi:hypothetical protein
MHLKHHADGLRHAQAPSHTATTTTTAVIVHVRRVPALHQAVLGHGL